MIEKIKTAYKNKFKQVIPYVFPMIALFGISGAIQNSQQQEEIAHLKDQSVTMQQKMTALATSSTEMSGAEVHNWLKQSVDNNLIMANTIPAFENTDFFTTRFNKQSEKDQALFIKNASFNIVSSNSAKPLYLTYKI